MRKTIEMTLVSLVFSLITAQIILWLLRAPLPLFADDLFDSIIPCQTITFLEYGPLNKSLYCLLQHVINDPLTTFYFKQTSVIVLLSVLFFVVLRAFEIPRILAALLTLWSTQIILDFNSTSELALACALLGGWAARANQKWGYTGFFVCMTAAFFVRPEYLLSLGLAVLLLTWRCFKTWQQQRDLSGWPHMLVGSGALLICVLLYLLAPNPMGDNRMWVAFGQHFAANYAAAHDLAGNPWITWKQIAADVFPELTTLQKLCVI